jgi:hypothetical protein
VGERRLLRGQQQQRKEDSEKRMAEPLHGDQWMNLMPSGTTATPAAMNPPCQANAPR